MSSTFLHAVNLASNNLRISATTSGLDINKKLDIKAAKRKNYEQKIDNSIILSSQRKDLFKFPSTKVIVRIATTPPDPHPI